MEFVTFGFGFLSFVQVPLDPDYRKWRKEYGIFVGLYGQQEPRRNLENYSDQVSCSLRLLWIRSVTNMINFFIIAM